MQRNNPYQTSSPTKGLFYLVAGALVAIGLSLALKSSKASKMSDKPVTPVRAETPQKVNAPSQKISVTSNASENESIFNKPDVIYVGIENPITLDAKDKRLNSEEILVSAKGAEVTFVDEGRYILKAKRPGNVEVYIENGGKDIVTRNYIAKRLPDPTVYLANDRVGGSIGAGEFKAQKALKIKVPDIGIDYECRILGFQLTAMPSSGSESAQINRGGEYMTDAKNLIAKAKPGDRYAFEKIKAKCPGDLSGRTMPTLLFMLK